MGTRMVLNRPLASSEGGGLSLTFNELSGIISIPAGGTIYLPLDAGSHRYEVKTVYAKPNKSAKIRVELKDRANAGFTYYGSLEQSEVHDIVNVPASDKGGTKKVHAFITNSGTETVSVEVIIKIIPMSGGN